MLDLIRFLFWKKGFTCRVLMPGAVYASRTDKRQIVVIIDLDQKA